MTTSLCDLLAKCEFFSLIEVGKKPCMNTMCFSSGMFGGMYRKLTWESADNLLHHINLYIHEINCAVSEYKDTSFLKLVINGVYKTIKPLETLLTTYKSRPKVTSRLTVYIQQLKSIVDPHKELISEHKEEK